MTSDLTIWVSARLDNDDKLPDDAKLLILAALEGDTELADMAGYSPPAQATVSIAQAEPVGAFLKQIKVRGFRGIGPEAQLDLDPFPSLTVISGRNGSGKSSFAEALEVTLTGTTYRWHKRTTQWRESWRNIHDSGETRIEVSLAEEGIGPTRLTATWPRDAELDGMVTSLQRHGEKKQSGLSGLGWDGPLETYRPMLSYEELGALLAAEPKVLYDAISTVLGLGSLSEAVKLLDDHRKTFATPENSLRNDKKTLVQSLGGLADDRATEALDLLAARSPDTAQLRHLATGTRKDDGVGTLVRNLLAINLPSESDCSAAADEIVASVSLLADVANDLGETLEGRSHLISAAISVHEHEGDQPCPVCAGGTLDAARVATLRAELERDRQELVQLQAARAHHAAALDAAQLLIKPVSAALAVDPPDVLSEFVDQLQGAWAMWSAAPTGPLELAAHLSTQCEPSRQALATLRSAAQDYLNRLDEAWGKVAASLGAYANATEECALNKDAAASSAAAHKWLKDNELVLKNQRVKPIANEAKAIWASLRQESNVEISDLTLAGSNTRRHVVIAAEVDGQDAGALAVMSQGELHALALALFLPRATMAQSPFRFVVLDDPVQAMDPAKVNGLVQVLLEIAKNRQVIVFSHDDRFASAVRRAPKGVPIKVLEVRREANSRVTPVVTHSPADRYLKDAFGLVKDDGLPDETRRRVLPGLLRMALEAQAREVFFSRELSAGGTHERVEATWDQTTKTRGRLGLALDDPSKVDAWIDKANYRRWALKNANAVHSNIEHSDLMGVCRDVEKTLTDIKNNAR